MPEVVKLLCDTHAMVLMDDLRMRAKITRLLREMGATVTEASNRNEAISEYWKLYRSGIRPRVMISCWWLAKPSTASRRFLETIGRLNEDGTALEAVRNVLEMDEAALTAVYTQDPGSAKATLSKAGLDKAEVYSRHEMDPINFVCRIACHPGIGQQRITPEQLLPQLELFDYSFGKFKTPVNEYAYG